MTESLPDTAPSDAAGADSSASLGELFLRYRETVYRVAYRLTGSSADAEDVLQDVFVGLPESLRLYKDRGNFGAWIRRVATRVALAQLRKRKRRSEFPLESVPPAATIGYSNRLIDRTALERAINNLPEKLRLVFVLRELEGYSHAEIASLLGIRPGTSEVRLHRAHAILRQTLRSSI